MPKIKWILFDWKDTIYDSVSTSKIAERNNIQYAVFKKHGINIRKDELKKYYLLAKQFIEFNYKGSYKRHAPGLVYSKLLKLAGIKLSLAKCKQMEKEFDNLFFENIVLFPGITSLLKKLKKNYFLAVISNTRKERLRLVLKKSKLKDYFDFTISSYELKAEKSKLTPFKHFLKMAGASPQEAIMIGNRIDEDLIAKKLGIKTILFDYYKKNKDQKYKPIHSISELTKELEMLIG